MGVVLLAASMARTGRRPGPNTSRAAILQAARQRFAEAGYDATSLRLIAADAGVDPAVVVHFFGSKEGLFQAAVGWPFDPARVTVELTPAGPGPIAERIARIFLGFWDAPATRASLLAVLRSAMTQEASATVLREFAVRHLFSHVTALLDGPEKEVELRVNLAAAHLIGVAVLRYVLRIEPLASASLDELVEWLTPALSRYLGESAACSPTRTVAPP
jgi:AcrR family transcriptional regulator